MGSDIPNIKRSIENAVEQSKTFVGTDPENGLGQSTIDIHTAIQTRMDPHMSRNAGQRYEQKGKKKGH